MQAAVVWRMPLGRGYSLTLAGAPVGEPALGPVAFMHRASAFENPTAPLAHHTFDSTHIAMGVLTAGDSIAARGRSKASLFHGGEPDDQRWDLMDPGPLDSWSVRGWYRPTTRGPSRLSHGFLNDAGSTRAGRRAADDRLGVVDRTRARTAGRLRRSPTDATTRSGGDFNAFLAEATHTFGANASTDASSRCRSRRDVLRFGVHTFVGREARARAGRIGDVDARRRDARAPEIGEGRDVLSTLTVGGGRDADAVPGG